MSDRLAQIHMVRVIRQNVLWFDDAVFWKADLLYLTGCARLLLQGYGLGEATQNVLFHIECRTLFWPDALAQWWAKDLFAILKPLLKASGLRGEYLEIQRQRTQRENVLRACTAREDASRYERWTRRLIGETL